jgi:phage baseplate assembly protein W
MLGSISKKITYQKEGLGNISRSFKDISFAFTKNPITKDIVPLKNEEAIKQCVKNLILTELGDRPFKPYLGTNSLSYLFELGSSIGANVLITEIENVLSGYESRIRLENIEVEASEDTSNVDVYIEYTIVGLPPEVQNLSFILVRES